MEVGSDTVKVVAGGSDDDSVLTWIQAYLKPFPLNKY